MTPTTDVALAAALEYARGRWPLLPLDDGLAPLAHEPTCDAGEIVRRWAAFPGAHPGVVLGRPIGTSRLHLVALVDRCTEASAAYLAEHGALDTLGLGHLAFAGGRAWLFASPEPLPSRELAPGLEVQGDGVLPLPPATTDRGGEWRWRKGRFLPDRALAAAPHWLRVAEARPAPDPDAPAVDRDWIGELVRNRRGAIVVSLANAATILRCDERYAGRLAYDEMALGVALDARPLGDADVVAMREQLERRYAVQVGDRMLRDALLHVAGAHPFHPVRAYLRGLRWDGVARLDDVARDVLHDERPLARSMVRRFLVAAAARALEPGCKVDTALVLVGPQGYFKSTFFRVLAGPWFSDTHLDPTNKDSLQQIAGAWLYELGEIDSITSRKHASDLKRFMTSATDAFRPPYERSVRQVPRAGVMCGSTNRDRFLTDDSGSRRFWVVRVPAPVDVAALVRQRDQLWAEAVAARDAGERWWLDDAEERERETDAEQHQEQDPWLEILVRYLRAQYRERRLRGEYTAAELATDALKIERKDLSRGLEMRLGDVLRRLGLAHRKVRIERDGMRLPPTWTWLFPNDEPEWLTLEALPAEVDPS